MEAGGSLIFVACLVYKILSKTTRVHRGNPVSNKERSGRGTRESEEEEKEKKGEGEATTKK